MLKKLTGLFALLSLLLLVGCSSGEKEVVAVEPTKQIETNETKEVENIKFSSVIESYEAEGISIDLNKKPAFDMIGAKDGVIFYIDNKPVKLYEYGSEEDLNKNAETYPTLNEWERKGLIVLETKSEKAIQIFNNIK